MKVSVAMCTYNGEKYIRKQLESIIRQSRRVDEIIISDDGSKDATLAICREILSNTNIPFQIVENKPSLKVIKNFQQCFSLCTGDLIFSCDQDDIWHENKVEIMLSYFENNDLIDMIATDAVLIDATDNVMNLSLKEGLDFCMDSQEKILPELLRTFCITGATMAFRKNFEQKYFYVSNYWLHDGWLALQSSMKNSFLYLNDKLTMYRLHGNNECGVGDVGILQNGTVEELIRVRKKKARKTAFRYPFYCEDLAKEKKEMYAEVKAQIDKNQWKVDSHNLELLNECISFWDCRANLRLYSFRQMNQLRRKWKNERKYERFCESPSYYYYDFYLWIIYRLIPRKSRGETND